MAEPATPETARQAWTRRLSQSGITRPALPNISGLRTALLGYIGEVENTLQDRLGGDVGTDDSLPVISSPSSMSGEDDGPWASSSTGASSSYISAEGLRKRGTGPGLPMTGGYSSLLDHLPALRQDITRYFPSRMSFTTPTTLGASGDWLRNLPQRLRMVDLSVNHADDDHDASTHTGNGSVESARRKVIELVHTLLPSEEWAGWERLGWEEQDRLDYGIPRRRHTVDLGRPEEGAEIDEEPEYLFPNRTPASAQAIPSRRRAVRSKSLGTAGFPEKWTSPSLPRLVRVQTEPWGEKTDDVMLADDSDDDEAVDEQVYLFPDSDVKPSPSTAFSEFGPTVAEALSRAEDGKKLITYDDLPFIWRNNEHIITGYRFIPLHASTGPIPLIKSAFTWHNETVNIHSHFIPTVLIFLLIPAIIYSSPLPDAHPIDVATLVIYLLAAVSCLISSAGWHVLSGCAARKWFEWGACVDYVGIAWLIAASFFTALYNAFYCQPKTVMLYSTINLVCGILGSTLPFQKWFNERRYKNWRIWFFLFLCYAMLVPMFQMFYQHGWTRGKTFVAPFCPSMVMYVTGLLFYGFHFPECVWPGRFDSWGASHQIWHAAIVGAIILSYRAIFTAHGLRYAYSCAMVDAGEPVSEVLAAAWWVVKGSMGF